METMKHPTPDRIQYIIDMLEKAMQIAGNDAPVNMMRPYIDFVHPCGTPHCHAGWFAIGALSAKSEIFKEYGVDSYSPVAEFMAQKLGFVKSFLLENWADSNPEIWGNKYGSQMFCGGAAFGFEDCPDDWTEIHKDKGDLQQIIDHWKGVRDRLIVHLQNNPQ